MKNCKVSFIGFVFSGYDIHSWKKVEDFSHSALPAPFVATQREVADKDEGVQGKNHWRSP